MGVLNPPLCIIAGITAILALISLLHLWGLSAGPPSQNLHHKLREVQSFVHKLESEVLRLESGTGTAVAAQGSQVPAAFTSTGAGDGLLLFSASARQGRKSVPVGGSMIDVVVRSNVSNYEVLRPGEGLGGHNGNADLSGSSSSSGSARSGSSTSSEADEDTVRWEQQLVRKLRCVSSHRGGIFLYHVRKAAGTSVKDVLQHASTNWRIPLYETEGLSLDPRFLEPRSLLSVLTIREPVDRALSMFWYEHVGWYDGILHQPHKCKTLAKWVEAWRDGSEWKRKFVSSNPRSVYVEIENYYIKMLIGWTGAGTIGERELEQAKTVLRHFDVVLVMEWMQDARQIDAMNALFPGRQAVAAKHMLRGDKKAKERLAKTLAPDEEKLRAEIAKFNAYDLQLWEFAQSLLARRLRVLQGLATSAHKAGPYGDDKTAHAQCGAHSHSVHGRLEKDLSAQLGVFRPPGHKGPF